LIAATLALGGNYRLSFALLAIPGGLALLALTRLRAAAPTHLRCIRRYFLETVRPEDLQAIERSMGAVARGAFDEPARPEGAGRCRESADA
jgi:hypothetical protein